MKNKTNQAYPSLNWPLTILGVERKLFFFLITISAALFIAFDAALPAIALFVVFYSLARIGQAADPQLLRIFMNSGRFAVRYDPAIRTPPKGQEDWRS